MRMMDQNMQLNIPSELCCNCKRAVEITEDTEDAVLGRDAR